MKKQKVSELRCAKRSMKLAPRDGTGVRSVAKDLTEHFFCNPEAGDTLEGIADWWIARQRRDNAITLVRDALEFLVFEGSVLKRTFGSREFYVSVPSEAEKTHEFATASYSSTEDRS